MLKPIKAKTILSSRTKPDPWFGCKYTINIYRGCPHQCIYCDSRSECYQIEDFTQTLYKSNTVERLKDELPRKRTKGVICFGSMSDTYNPYEKKLRLSRSALEVIHQYKFPIHIITKSDLIIRDLNLIKAISQESYAAVSFTITTADDKLAKKVEPGAPSPSLRFKAMKTLAQNGIYTGITMMPVLPFIEDKPEQIKQLLEQAKKHQAQYILPWFGMTLRDRQRTYYYKKLDLLFPGISAKYKQRYRSNYGAESPRSQELNLILKKFCQKNQISTKMKHYRPTADPQLNLKV